MAEISRRDSLAWIVAAASSPYLVVEAQGAPNAAIAGASPWRDMALAPLKARGYGKDAKLTEPSTPWPLTLTPHRRQQVRIAADLILPADGRSPSAGSLPIDAFLDEWISAPYPQQREDRVVILSGLAWLDAESRRRHGLDFTRASDAQRRGIFDAIAFKGRIAPDYAKPAQFFARLRALVLGGFYSLPEGMADIGYVGNKPIAGDYPGPTAEALTHLNAGLARVGIKPFSAG